MYTFLSCKLSYSFQCVQKCCIVMYTHGCRVTIACGGTRGTCTVAPVQHQGAQFCIEGHGWLPSRLLYRNCKSVCTCVMVRETRQYLFILYGHRSHSGFHWCQTISAPLSAREHMYAQFCIIFFAYNQSDRYVLHCICIINSSKLQWIYL